MTKAHTIANATYHSSRRTRSGDRFKFTCPSSREGVAPHAMWCSGAGTEASCSCEGYQTHGHCTLTQGAPDLMLRLYRDRCAQASDGTLHSLDYDYQYAEASGTLTDAQRLVWSAVGDEVAARLNRINAA